MEMEPAISQSYVLKARRQLQQEFETALI
ncbi:hypothetical protein CCACVL1_19739 [Corchorus capsularis]|uniref:Uncharacterized protein n=1 Tax=Corchorus capsularis TaxID=210143 RepID=A0A1R3HF49_COCAP|nr:hypothetical protein CCACVL1_19739 [Corchorus capsularis]